MMILGAVLLQGCMTSYVEWVEKGTSRDVTPAGVYQLSGSADWLKTDSQINQGVADIKEVPQEGSALPINVDVQSITKDTTGGVATFNNIFSYCTLGIWPCISSEETRHSITISSPETEPVRAEAVTGKRQWSSFVLPIGALPCPGWGDERGFKSDLKASGGLGRVQCKKEIFALLSGQYYENNMAKLITKRKAKRDARIKDEKEFREKVESAAKKIQAIVAARDNRLKSSANKDTRAVVLLDEKDIRDRTSSTSRSGQEAIGSMSAVMDELETTLTGLGFRVVTKRSVGRSLEEKSLLSALTSNVTGAESDKLSIPAYRVEAVVFQYGVETKNTKNTTVSDGLIVNKVTERAVGRVDVSLKFINIGSGETEYAVQHLKKEAEESRVRTAMSKDGNLVDKVDKSEPIVPERILAKALREVFQSVAHDIACKMKPFRVVECSDDGTLVVDATESVVKPGEKLQVYAVGKGKVRNGKVYRQETPVAVARVTDVREYSSTAVFERIDRVNCEWDIVLKPMGK